MSIATKTGDKGETSLMYGRRVPKTHERVEACGSIDELNSALGLARAAATDKLTREKVRSIQLELITVMGELATVPEDLPRYEKDGFIITTSAMTDRVTALIDEIERADEMKFNDWVVPGASMESAALDLARTACRRAERCVAALTDTNPEILRYLNRLSDLCWLLARQSEKRSGQGGS
ncbi:MAG: cob(I)yrinic acid a,c-diamide adenosyltransferase [Chthoniobacterales bacterium]|nr:MAG: cob(I)yrinic acid a,c-diamide adenosyltransferase [Chthoniobacterales bacterium]